MVRPSTYRLADGTFIGCRPVLPGDRGKLLAGFQHLSRESRYSRFFISTPRLTTAMVDRLFDIDGKNRAAIGAEQMRFGVWPGEGVGIARFARMPGSPETAEIAVAIVDEMQRLGVGTILLRELAKVARAASISRFTAWVQPDNTAMKTLVSSLDPFAKSRGEDGLLVFDLAVPETVPAGTDEAVRLTPVRAFARWGDDRVRRILPVGLGGRSPPSF